MHTCFKPFAFKEIIATLLSFNNGVASTKLISRMPPACPAFGSFLTAPEEVGAPDCKGVQTTLSSAKKNQAEKAKHEEDEDLAGL